MLTSVTLGEDVMRIGGNAFYNCTGLTAINFIGTKDQWDAISKGYNWDYNTGNYALHYVGEETSEE